LRTDRLALASISNLDELARQFSSLKKVKELLSKLDYSFNNHKLLTQAFLHRSIVNELSFKTSSNERLEFLGDSILGLLVSTSLFQDFNDLKEGDLSKFRSALVNEESLARLSDCLDLEQIVLMGKGELSNNINEKASVMGDVFEAFLGAIYLDSDLNRTNQVLDTIIQIFEKEMEVSFFDFSKVSFFDAKTKLQEETMKLYKVTPCYKSLKMEQGFKVTASIKGKPVLSIEGTSKKKTERELAQKILQEKLYLNITSKEPLCLSKTSTL